MEQSEHSGVCPVPTELDLSTELDNTEPESNRAWTPRIEQSQQRGGSALLASKQQCSGRAGLCFYGQRQRFLEGASQHVFQPVLRDQSVMLLPP